MSEGYPDFPEAVALALWREIKQAEEKADERSRSNRPERERLLALYKECLWAVTGAEREPLRSVH